MLHVLLRTYVPPTPLPLPPLPSAPSAQEAEAGLERQAEALAAELAAREAQVEGGGGA